MRTEIIATTEPVRHADLLGVDDLVVGYRGAALLPPISMVVRPGERWVIVGRNGSGKSTFLKTILGLLAPVAGRVLKDPALRVAYLPQRHGLDSVVPFRAIDLVTEGLDRGWSFLMPRRAGYRARVRAAMARTGVEAFARSRFDDLSEGQKQRVLLARALVGEPSVIFLDEPTSAMDLVAQQTTLDILDDLRLMHQTAVVMVTHHLSSGLSNADKALFLDAEHGVVACGTVQQILADPTFEYHFGGLVDHHPSQCETGPLRGGSLAEEP